MEHRGHRLGLWLIFLPGCVFAAATHQRPATTPAGQTALQAKRAEANRYFTNFFSKTQPGCSVVVRREGTEVYSQAFGSARLLGEDEPESKRIPNRPTQKMRVASVSKPVLATGILYLRDQRLKSGLPDLLDMNLGKIYPKLKGTPLNAITVRQLLEHTSGLKSEPRSVPEHDHDLAKEISQRPRQWLTGSRPGEKFSYSNVGYMLLGDVIYRLSGQIWQNYLKENVFTPLGMEKTSFEDPSPLQESGELAEGYEGTGDGYRFKQFDRSRRRLLGSGGLISTAEDLAKFAEAARKKEILGADSWQEALKVSEASKRAGDPCGLGYEVQKLSDGGTTFGHPGDGYGSYTLMRVFKKTNPPCELSVVILCNFDGGTIAGFDRNAAAKRMESLFCASN